MKMSEYYRQREAEEMALAARYERCPEDAQKAAGAKEARRQAEWYRAQAEAEEAAEKAVSEAENATDTNIDMNKEEEPMNTTVKTHIDYELEVERNNVTPAQFLAYVRARAAKAGCPVDLDLAYFKGGQEWGGGCGYWNSHYDWGIPGDRACASEICKWFPYDQQTYVRGFDGTVYNEIIEFTFDDEKKGHGYYYLVQTAVNPEDEENNKRIYLEKLKKHLEDEIAKAERDAAKAKAKLEEDGRWMTSWGRENLATDIRIAEMTAENRRDDLKAVEEMLNPAEAEAEAEVESTTTESGLSYEEFQALAKANYTKGGDVVVECWGRTEFEEYITEFGAMTGAKAQALFDLYRSTESEAESMARWASGEPDPTEAADPEPPTVTRTESLEDKVYRMLFDSIEDFNLDYDKVMNAIADHLDLDEDTFCRLYDEFKGEYDLYVETRDSCVEIVPDQAYEDEGEEFDFEEKDYGPSNPWDAPGMKVSDFITGVCFF